jgi:hypothetical protein
MKSWSGKQKVQRCWWEEKTMGRSHAHYFLVINFLWWMYWRKVQENVDALKSCKKKCNKGEKFKLGILEILCNFGIKKYNFFILAEIVIFFLNLEFWFFFFFSKPKKILQYSIVFSYGMGGHFSFHPFNHIIMCGQLFCPF